MKKYLFIALLWLSASAHAQGNLSALVPLPNHMETASGEAFVLTTRSQISFSQPDLAFAAETLRKELTERMGITLSASQSATAKGDISLAIDKSIEGKEHYVLTVQEKGITIKGGSAAAVFRGVMTLRQMLLGDDCNTASKRIAATKIDDAPRFGYRALMLDPHATSCPCRK